MRCPLCDNHMDPPESIDEQVTETFDQLEKIHNEFMVDGVCQCPLCEVLFSSDDAQPMPSAS